ncbi:MAG: hypothetical protein M1829_001166 [Trizodia sp. TS-e1964]|nr:MAG: hypothetical protein M1829_001166 [Trizodia sp. TS-e1964]
MATLPVGFQLANVGTPAQLGFDSLFDLKNGALRILSPKAQSRMIKESDVVGVGPVAGLTCVLTRQAPDKEGVQIRAVSKCVDDKLRYTLVVKETGFAFASLGLFPNALVALEPAGECLGSLFGEREKSLLTDAGGANEISLEVIEMSDETGLLEGTIDAVLGALNTITG